MVSDLGLNCLYISRKNGRLCMSDIHLADVFMAWFLCYIILNQRSSAGIITHCSMLNRTEQNRTVSLLISGHIHDIEIQCEQQNVIYTGLGIFFLFKIQSCYADMVRWVALIH